MHMIVPLINKIVSGDIAKQIVQEVQVRYKNLKKNGQFELTFHDL